MNNNGFFMISSEGELYLREINLDYYKETLEKSSKIIKHLDLRNNSIRLYPPFMCDLKNLLTLDLRENLLETMPEDFYHLVSLQTLKLDNNRLSVLPVALYLLSNLDTLTLSHNKLMIIDQNIKN